MKAKDKNMIAKNKLFVLPNFDDEIEMLQWAGISFGTDDAFRLSKSIKVSTLKLTNSASRHYERSRASTLLWQDLRYPERLLDCQRRTAVG